MLKIGAASLVGLGVLGWLVLGPGQLFDNEPPPTIRAEPGPIKHRPDGYVAEQNQLQATKVSSTQDPQNTPPIDVILRLAR